MTTKICQHFQTISKQNTLTLTHKPHLLRTTSPTVANHNKPES
jgi:hypothetical protein